MDDIVERLRMMGNAAAEEAADEIERLRSDGSLLAMARNLSEMREEIERLRAECEAMRKDAERYRWLRDIEIERGQR